MKHAGVQLLQVNKSAQPHHTPKPPTQMPAGVQLGEAGAVPGGRGGHRRVGGGAAEGAEAGQPPGHAHPVAGGPPVAWGALVHVGPPCLGATHYL